MKRRGRKENDYDDVRKMLLVEVPKESLHPRMHPCRRRLRYHPTLGTDENARSLHHVEMARNLPPTIDHAGKGRRLLNEWSARTRDRTLLHQMPADDHQPLPGDVGPVQIFEAGRGHGHLRANDHVLGAHVTGIGEIAACLPRGRGVEATLTVRGPDVDPIHVLPGQSHLRTQATDPLGVKDIVLPVVVGVGDAETRRLAVMEKDAQRRLAVPDRHPAAVTHLYVVGVVRKVLVPAEGLQVIQKWALRVQRGEKDAILGARPQPNQRALRQWMNLIRLFSLPCSLVQIYGSFWHFTQSRCGARLG